MLDTPVTLWQLSVTEQRYRAVLEVLAGVPVARGCRAARTKPAGASCLAVPRPDQPHRVSLTASAQSVSIRGSFGLYERAVRLTIW